MLQVLVRTYGHIKKEHEKKNTYLGSVCSTGKHMLRVRFQSLFTKVISTTKYKCTPPPPWWSVCSHHQVSLGEKLETWAKYFMWHDIYEKFKQMELSCMCWFTILHFKQRLAACNFTLSKIFCVWLFFLKHFLIQVRAFLRQGKNLVKCMMSLVHYVAITFQM